MQKEDPRIDLSGIQIQVQSTLNQLRLSVTYALFDLHFWRVWFFKKILIFDIRISFHVNAAI